MRGGLQNCSPLDRRKGRRANNASRRIAAAAKGSVLLAFALDTVCKLPPPPHYGPTDSRPKEKHRL